MKDLRKTLICWLDQLIRQDKVELAGDRILDVKKHLDPFLAQMFGYHALLYGKKALELVSDELVIKNQWVISPETSPAAKQPVEKNSVDIFGRFEELPVASDSIDLIIMPEALQQSRFPHQVLREAERVLIPEGQIILIMRNPLGRLNSLIRIQRWLNPKTRHHSIIGRRRLTDWFGLLGFQIKCQIPICRENKKIISEGVNQIFVKVPLLRSVLNQVAKIWCETTASYYIIVAEKQVSTLIPIRPSWRRNKRLVRPRFAEPSIRSDVEHLVKQLKN